MSYFDNNATTPLDAGARQVLFDAHSENWANPSSPYRSSAQIRASMQKCRDKISSNLGVDSDHLIFTSGATEANNSVFANLSRQVDAEARVLLSPYEHPSVVKLPTIGSQTGLIYFVHSPMEQSASKNLPST